MKEEIIMELSSSRSFLAKILEILLENQKVLAEEQDGYLRISNETISKEIQLALTRSGYLLKKPVDDTSVYIQTDMEYLYFYLN